MQCAQGPRPRSLCATAPVGSSRTVPKSGSPSTIAPNAFARCPSVSATTGNATRVSRCSTRSRCSTPRRGSPPPRTRAGAPRSGGASSLEAIPGREEDQRDPAAGEICETQRRGARLVQDERVQLHPDESAGTTRARSASRTPAVRPQDDRRKRDRERSSACASCGPRRPGGRRRRAAAPCPCGDEPRGSVRRQLDLLLRGLHSTPLVRRQARERTLGGLGGRRRPERLDLAHGARELRVLPFERRVRHAREHVPHERHLREHLDDRAQVAAAGDASEQGRDQHQQQHDAEQDQRCPDEPSHGRAMVPASRRRPEWIRPVRAGRDPSPAKAPA